MPGNAGSNSTPTAVHAPFPHVPTVVLCAAILLTALAAFQVDRATKATEEAHYRSALETAAREVRDRIAQRREAYVAILHGTAGLFAGDRYVPPPVFARYVSSLKLRESYPGVQGIGVLLYARNASDLKLARHHLAELGLVPRVWPENPPRDVYCPLIHLEPLDDANRRALGYDPYSDPVRREAIERARDEGTVGVTAKVQLVQDFGPQGPAQAGFVMYYPIFRTADLPPATTPQERRDRILAFVCSPFRADDFLRGTFPEGFPASLGFELYDGTELTGSHLLSAAGAATAPGGWPVGRPLTIDMGGQTWTLAFRTRQRPPADSGLSRAAVAVAAAGGAIAMLLFALTRSQWRARRSAERTSAELREAAVQLRHREQERVQLLAAEKDARAEAEAANRSKDEFLATLSHELRTPLNAILGWSQLLRVGALPPDEATQGLETIERNAKAQAQLVDDLLDVSRIISGKLRLDAMPVDLVGVVEGALDSVRPAAEAKGIRLVPVLDAHAGRVIGDAGRLQQVAWNLLSNAVKFTPRGGRVDVWLCARGADAELTVSDSGAGISAEFLPRVFDRLRQADASTTRRHGGLGLGLAIVRHLVELHGGTVSAASGGEGLGATFTVRLPVATGDPSPAPDLRPDATNRPSPLADAMTPIRRHGPGDVLEGVNVLLVDDEADTREVLQLSLEQRGARVTVASSAPEALAAMRDAARSFDVLISDIGMPDDDGYALIRSVRQLEPSVGGNVPAVALTAYARPEDRACALDAGFQEHVAKPVEPAALVLTLAELLAGSRGGARRIAGAETAALRL